MLFVVFVLFVSFQQIPKRKTQNEMDLKDIIFDASTAIKFIDLNFKTAIYDQTDLLLSNHSMALNKFNRELKDTGNDYKLFNLPINNLYAYKEDKNGFCLYILMDFDRAKLATLLKEMGLPINVPGEDIISGEFDFLFWKKSDLNYDLMRDRFGDCANNSDGQKVVFKLTNLDSRSFFMY